MASAKPVPGEIYLEFTVVGAYQRCTAIDAATALEVFVSGPLSASRADLERLAVGKLKRRLAEAGRG